MLFRKTSALALLIGATAFAQAPAELTPDAKAKAGVETRRMIQRAPKLPLAETELAVYGRSAGFELGMVSWVALDGKGTIYLLQRGDKADPVIAADLQGRVLRSWGKGLFKLPHAIRIDPAGDIWTVDANSSVVYKFTPTGQKLLEINVGGQPPETRSPFVGTTDVAFGPNGRIFIADGYGNARILEYTAEGKKVREWGKPGTGPGEFRLPHSIVVGPNGMIYVADRENGRIERFTLDGAYVGEWRIGKTYSLKLAGDALWAGMHPVDEPTASPGWLVKLDTKTGAVLGSAEVPEKSGLHSVEVTPAGEPITVVANHVMWFRK
jgi:DNA-binding beta-propeller fold protein YncE